MIGTVGLTWMLIRYSSGDLSKSLVRFLPELSSGRGHAGVTGLWICSTLAGTRARRAMNDRTGTVAITLPTSSARFVIDSKAPVSTLRLRTIVWGVSTRTRVDAAAIPRLRAFRPG